MMTTTTTTTTSLPPTARLTTATAVVSSTRLVLQVGVLAAHELQLLGPSSQLDFLGLSVLFLYQQERVRLWRVVVRSTSQSISVEGILLGRVEVEKERRAQLVAA